MSAIILLLIVSIVVALGFLLAFLWAVRTGQFDDTFTPSVRMLFEQRSESKPNERGANSNGEN